MIDYYTPPTPHPHEAEIVKLEGEYESLCKEYAELEEAEWTREGEARGLVIEILLEEIARKINYLEEQQ